MLAIDIWRVAMYLSGSESVLQGCQRPRLAGSEELRIFLTAGLLVHN